MSQFLSPILTLVLNYGYPIVISCVLCGYLGIPIPSDAILLAAGSFSADGTLNIFILIPLIALTAILGDLFGYYLGRRFGHLVINRFTSKVGLSQKKLDSMDEFLKKWGVWCIFITRWLLTPLGIPVNIVAGTSKYPLRKFLFIVAFGEILWAGIYIYLGYLFGANWVNLLDYINEAPWFLAIITVGIVSLVVGVKIWRKR